MSCTGLEKKKGEDFHPDIGLFQSYSEAHPAHFERSTTLSQAKMGVRSYWRMFMSEDGIHHKEIKVDKLILYELWDLILCRLL